MHVRVCAMRIYLLLLFFFLVLFFVFCCCCCPVDTVRLVTRWENSQQWGWGKKKKKKKGREVWTSDCLFAFKKKVTCEFTRRERGREKKRGEIKIMNGADDDAHNASVIASVFRRHRYPFHPVTVERLLCTFEQLLESLPSSSSSSPSITEKKVEVEEEEYGEKGEKRRSAIPSIGTEVMPPVAAALDSNNNGASHDHPDGGMSDDGNGPFCALYAKLQALLEQHREVRRLCLEKESQRQLQMYPAPFVISVGAEERVHASSHVSMIISTVGNTLPPSQRCGSPRKGNRQFMSAQHQREMNYLLHVVHAAYVETQRWQSRCKELQVELDGTKSQCGELMAEVDELRVLLAQERMMSQQLLQQQQQQEEEEKLEDEKKEEEKEKEKEGGGGEINVSLNSAGKTVNDNGIDKSPSVPGRVILSPLPVPATAHSPLFSPPCDVVTTPPESHLERLAREDFVSPPHSAPDGNDPNDAIAAAAAAHWRSSLFTSPLPVTFARPSLSSLQAARQAVAATNTGVKTKDVASAARGRHGGDRRHVHNKGDGDNPDHDAVALRLLRRLVPDVSDGLLNVSVGVYEGVYKLATRCRRAEEGSRRHLKRLRELEAQAATVPRLEECLQRQTRLSSTLHCRVEEKEDMLRQLKMRLAAADRDIAELKRQLAEHQQREKPNEAGEEEEAGGRGKGTDQQPEERSAIERQQSCENGDARQHRCRGAGPTPKLAYVNAPHGRMKKRRNDGGKALLSERARADNAEAELSRAQQELACAQNELQEGKHLLACLVRDGQRELPEYNNTDIKEEGDEHSSTVPTMTQSQVACGSDIMDLPEPQPPQFPSPSVPQQEATPTAAVAVAAQPCELSKVHAMGQISECSSFLLSICPSLPSGEGELAVLLPIMGSQCDQKEWEEEQQKPTPNARKPKKKNRSKWEMELEEDDTVAPWGDW
ncbi:hypothetical protein ECC02_006156 [Trypanosoma cruzi]|uniref:Uncharacterized protein n=1 Tax=Trypanosoma cruzi TaxID=5693 RepID=A0A7J6Y278_TRYCR|nr:hypothetical protein ECC02_006156 [Trypanosoma cruzi]